MKKSVLFIVCILLAISIGAQNPDRIYQSHNEEDGKLSVITNDGK